MPLLLLKTGEKRIISRVIGKDNIKQRIQDMGLIEGFSIEILSYLTGNVIVIVKGSKLAISNDVASRIHVI
jgi:ferrous iron transport protein A